MQEKISDHTAGIMVEDRLGTVFRENLSQEEIATLNAISGALNGDRTDATGLDTARNTPINRLYDILRKSARYSDCVPDQQYSRITPFPGKPEFQTVVPELVEGVKKSKAFCAILGRVRTPQGND